MSAAILVVPAGLAPSLEGDLYRAWQRLGPGGRLVIAAPDAKVLDEVLGRATGAGFDGALRGRWTWG